MAFSEVEEGERLKIEKAEKEMNVKLRQEQKKNQQALEEQRLEIERQQQEIENKILEL